jgi:hypothetical protein
MKANDRHLAWFLAAEFAFGVAAILTFLFVGGELGLAIFAFCMIGFLVSFSVVVIQPDLTKFETYQESDILDDEFEFLV